MCPEWKTVVDARLRSIRDQLDADLRAECDALFERRHLLGADIAPYISPLAQPVFTIVRWASDQVELPESTIVDLIESSILGYLVVRIHDDCLDEGVGDPASNLLLSNRFMVRHQRRVAEHVGASAEYWAMHERVWADYGNAMAFEQRCLKRDSLYSEESFERVLLRSQPLVLPLAAAFVAGGRPDLLGVSEQLVRHAVRSAQLFNDTRDAADDVARGQYTWVARQLNADEGVGAIRMTLMRGGLATMVGQAKQEMVQAETLALESGLITAAAFCRERIRALSNWQNEVYRALFSRLLGS
jgi:hypothetical protein